MSVVSVGTPPFNPAPNPDARKSGARRVVPRYDNELGKGDHRHIDEKEEDYSFTTIDQLLDDFERGEEAMVLVPYESVEILMPLAQVV